MGWITRFLAHHGYQDPSCMGSSEVVTFLEYLVVNRNVAVSTQKQALNSLVFLYTQVLEQPLGELGEFKRAKRPAQLPVVLTRPEIKRLFDCLNENTFKVMAGLLYGCGMRLMECIRLRVQNLDFGYHQIIIRNAKGLGVPWPSELPTNRGVIYSYFYGRSTAFSQPLTSSTPRSSTYSDSFEVLLCTNTGSMCSS